jgi:hypothetical protein
MTTTHPAIAARRILTVSLTVTAILIGGGDPRERPMINVPIWLFYLLLGATSAALIGLLWIRNRTQKLIDRTLDKELYRPPLTGQQQARHRHARRHDGDT